MYDPGEMKSCIQEWFAEALDVKEVARTYHAVLLETVNRWNT
ncbi:MAG: hypothetical protein ACRDBO_12275 [Lachnospiraceae bacterium]